MGVVNCKRSAEGRMSAIPSRGNRSSKPPFTVGDPVTDIRLHLKYGFHAQEFMAISDQEPASNHHNGKKLTPTEEATKQANLMKNRYSLVVPFDHTRVKLRVSDDPFEPSDYINANHIQGEDINFIATQGPLPSTIADFWRMVWETQAGIIVMLTKEKEGQRIKCDRYWPEAGDSPESFQHGNLRLELVSVEQHPEHELISRTFKLFHGKEKDQEGRIVTQLQFLGWPDHGIPERPESILDLVHRLEETRQRHSMQTKPVIVHCSAGIGRTGAFLAVHIQITKLSKHRRRKSKSHEPFKFDVWQTVIAMRKQRIGMVQQPEQYRLIYEALLLEVEKLNSSDSSSTGRGSSKRGSQ